MPIKHKHAALPFLADSGEVTGRRDAAPPRSVATKTELKRHGELSSAAVDLVAERFRILGEPLRVRIIQELQNGERSVCQLADALGATQPNVSKHLRIIQGAAIAGRRHDGNLVYYFITDESVFDLCDAVCASVGDRLSREAAMADELHAGLTGRRR